MTHDIATLADYAFERVAAGKPMPGVFAVHAEGPIGSAIEETFPIRKLEAAHHRKVIRIGSLADCCRVV